MEAPAARRRNGHLNLPEDRIGLKHVIQDFMVIASMDGFTTCRSISGMIMDEFATVYTDGLKPYRSTMR